MTRIAGASLSASGAQTEARGLGFALQVESELRLEGEMTGGFDSGSERELEEEQ